jgi:hypothetical protein
MSRRRFTKPVTMVAGLILGLLFATLAVPLGAQPVPKAPYYDISKEVTLAGTVSSVITKFTPGMISGSHLMLVTGRGDVDASLGRWGLEGKGALKVTAGQQVEATGVMKTLKDREVFVVRVVKMGSHVYTMRNVHGIAVSPQGRARVNQKAAFKSEAL